MNIISKKVNGTVKSLTIVGVLLLFLGVLIASNSLIARLALSTVVILIASTFFYLAYKIYAIKREVEKIFKWK